MIANWLLLRAWMVKTSMKRSEIWLINLDPTIGAEICKTRPAIIVKFDKNLRFVARFGRDGRGPSEFTTKYSPIDDRISIDGKGNVFVVDFNPTRFIIFDNTGRFQDEIPFDRDYFGTFGQVFKIKLAGDGVFAGLKYSKNSPPIGTLFSIKPAKEIATYPFIEKQTPGNYIDDSFGEQCFHDCDGRHIVFANSQLYKLRVFDLEGQTMLDIEDKKQTVGHFSDAEMNVIIAEHFTPQNGYSEIRNSILSGLRADKPRFNKLLDHIRKNKNIISAVKISGVHLYVFLVAENICKKSYPVNIYNLKGQLIRKVLFPNRPVTIWQDYVFFLDRNDEDDPLILKYRIKI